jgi:hypothetical protein
VEIVVQQLKIDSRMHSLKVYGSEGLVKREVFLKVITVETISIANQVHFTMAIVEI